LSEQPLVLMVDDEMGILRPLQLEMETHGFRVVTAWGAEQALQLIDEELPDILLLDVMMPETNGIEMMRRLKQHPHLPVILLTANEDEVARVRGLELGADDYIVKPLIPEEVAARARAVLRRSAAQRTDRVGHAGAAVTA
jgi:DNA-binding response OmpR family regulator